MLRHFMEIVRGCPSFDPLGTLRFLGIRPWNPPLLQVALMAVSAATASVGHVLEEQAFVKRPEDQKKLILEGPLADALQQPESDGGRGGGQSGERARGRANACAAAYADGLRLPLLRGPMRAR